MWAGHSLAVLCMHDRIHNSSYCPCSLYCAECFARAIDRAIRLSQNKLGTMGIISPVALSCIHYGRIRVKCVQFLLFCNLLSKHWEIWLAETTEKNHNLCFSFEPLMNSFMRQFEWKIFFHRIISHYIFTFFFAFLYLHISFIILKKKPEPCVISNIVVSLEIRWSWYSEHCCNFCVIFCCIFSLISLATPALIVWCACNCAYY